MLLRSFGDSNSFNSHVAFSSDSRVVISSTPTTIWFWNATDGSLIETFDEESGVTWPSSIAVSPDGRSFALGRFDQSVTAVRYAVTTPDPNNNKKMRNTVRVNGGGATTVGSSNSPPCDVTAAPSQRPIFVIPRAVLNRPATRKKRVAKKRIVRSRVRLRHK